MANLFNGGYSKQSTLEGNLIQGEDRSDRILDESKRYLQQWKTASEGERENQRIYLEALQNKFDEETSDRAFSFDAKTPVHSKIISTPLSPQG